MSGAEKLATGVGCTTTLAKAVPVQLPVVPVTVYVVLSVGDAMAVFTPEALAPALQVYVVAPEAERCATSPEQMVSLVAVMLTLAPTVTVEVAVLVHPNNVPVTV